MKIWAFSDLHLRYQDPPLERVLGPVPDAEVCVVAGDMGHGDVVSSIQWLAKRIRPHMRVALVLGNHEFYEQSGHDRIRALAGRAGYREGIDVLDDMSVDIDGVRFLGSTLWTDFDVFGGGGETARAYGMRAASSMNDYKYPAIDGQSQRWSPALSRKQHFESRAWLEAELEASTLPTVVVTHHAPHPNSIATEYERDLATTGFVSDLTDVIERHQPALWLHGHTHHSFDYNVGETRIMCNPHGYGQENYRRFDPGLVIEMEGCRPRPPGV